MRATSFNSLLYSLISKSKTKPMKFPFSILSLLSMQFEQLPLDVVTTKFKLQNSRKIHVSLMPHRFYSK